MKKIIFAALLCALLVSCRTSTSDSSVNEDTGTEAAATSDAAASLPEDTSETESSEVEDKSSEADGFSSEDAETLAVSLCGDMVEYEYDEIYELFSDTMKNAVSMDSLKTSWEQVTGNAGDYVGIYETVVGEKSIYKTVECTLEYSDTGLKLIYAFGPDGKIEGMNVSYASIPREKETDDYTEVSVKVGEYELEGFLTLPKGVDDPPVVILVQGSGSTDMNETVGKNKPFYDIAHGLAENGIASLRFNKRFYQITDYSGEITIEAEVLEDVDAAIELVKSRDDVDGGNIYILGHSLGGLLAPHIAANFSDVKGIISLAGTPRRLEDVIVDQLMAAFSEDEPGEDVGEDEINSKMELYMTQAQEVKELTKDSHGDHFGINDEYWYSLNQIDQGKDAQGLEIPMLFLQGADDIQVYADVDYVQWQELLKGKENCQFKIYEGLGHLFVGEDEKVCDYVIDDIAGFIKNSAE